MEWQPIETAPRDGTRILLANAKLFAAGFLFRHVEPAEKLLGYDEGLVNEFGWNVVGPNFSKRVPNPKAGQIQEWWTTDNPSAFLREDEELPDHNGGFDSWEPTHWMPLFARPAPALEAAAKRDMEPMGRTTGGAIGMP